MFRLHRVVIAGLATVAVAAPRAGAQPYAGHGASSVSPETIARYAPPPLPPDIERRVQASLDVRAPGSGVLAPGGRALYFGWNITGTPQIWRVDGPRAFPVQMTGGEDRTGVVDVTPDGRWLVVSRDVGGQEDPGVYLQPAGGGALRVVHHVKATRTFAEYVTADSKAILFRTNDRAPDSFAIYRYDIASGTTEPLFTDPGLWSVADVRELAGDLRLLLARATGALSTEYYEWSSNTRVLTPLLGQGEHVEYQARFAAQPGELLVVTNKLGEFRRLYRWRAGSFTPVTPEMKMDVAGFTIDEPRRRVYYTVNDGGYVRARALDARTFGEVALPPIANAEQVDVAGVSRDGRFVVLRVGLARAPSASYVYDWQTRALTEWVLPSAPEIDTSRFAVATLETFPARDGTPIPMFVRYPDRCAPGAAPPAVPCPIVVEFHGGPEGQATPGFDTYAQLFVDAGFVFVEPNVRGSDGYGKAWLDADNGPKRLGVITDIEDCGRFLRQKFTRDGRSPKVAIIGGSYGGYSTLVGMTMFAGTYDAGVSVVGISNLASFLANTAPYRRTLRASEYGDPVKDADALAKLSPVTYLDRVTGPLLLIQGVDDPRVPVGEAIQMHEALEKRGVRSQLILLVGEGHGAARRPGQVVTRGHTLRFLIEQIGGETAAGR